VEKDQLEEALLEVKYSTIHLLFVLSCVLSMITHYVLVLSFTATLETYLPVGDLPFV